MGYEWKIIKSIFIMAGSRLEDHFTNSKDWTTKMFMCVRVVGVDEDEDVQL